MKFLFGIKLKITLKKTSIDLQQCQTQHGRELWDQNKLKITCCPHTSQSLSNGSNFALGFTGLHLYWEVEKISSLGSAACVIRPQQSPSLITKCLCLLVDMIPKTVRIPIIQPYVIKLYCPRAAAHIQSL
jgi:hypothetical protein